MRKFVPIVAHRIFYYSFIYCNLQVTMLYYVTGYSEQFFPVAIKRFA